MTIADPGATVAGISTFLANKAAGATFSAHDRKTARKRPLSLPLRRIPLVLALVVAAPRGQAADPVPYTVAIAPTNTAALDAAAHDSSSLVSLQTIAPVGPFALVARARGDLDRFTSALHSFGYYDGIATITIDGRSLDDPALPALLDATPNGTKVAVAVTLRPGPRFHLGQVTLTGDPVPDSARQTLDLKPGQPAVAADVLAARDRLLKALLDSGHALAKVGIPAATLEPGAQVLDVSFPVTVGPRVDLGPISIAGLKRAHADYLRRRLLIHQGERFDPDRIEAARQDLSNTGLFSTVRITRAEAPDADGQLPLQVQVAERPLHVVTLGAAYSTDLGGSLTASWTHRNLFGNGEQLTLSAAATELGGTAALQPGYNVSATLNVPDWLQRDQTLTLNALAVREYLIAYNRTALVSGGTVSRKLDRDLSVSVGVTGEEASIFQEGVTRLYTLLQTPVSLQYDTTRDLLNPLSGIRAALSVTPTESFANPNATFVIAQASGSTYLDLLGNGRSVLALHGLVGSVEGASTFAIPPDQRFYGGGSGTVRGFRFQSVGPQFPDGIPIGGTSIDAGSLELRQRFGASYGAAVFVDAGQVSTSGVPFQGTVQVGVGIGARYYTSFGPLRLDFAVPVTNQPNSDAFEVYIGIGQAF